MKEELKEAEEKEEKSEEPKEKEQPSGFYGGHEMDK